MKEIVDIMTNNDQFLNVIRSSFKSYLDVGTSRSTNKLKPLHGCIARDLASLLGGDFRVQSQGYREDKEATIHGRYIDKDVDIAVSYRGKYVGGFAVKFVMRNYSQNSNNYFENMLGETANIRTAGIPYFQIFIIFDKVPYFTNGGVLKKYDEISNHNIDKYIALSQDNPSQFYHTPDKTLLVILKLKEPNREIIYDDDYNNCYIKLINDIDLLLYSNKIKDNFSNSVILNDYEDFMQRCADIIKGNLKK